MAEITGLGLNQAQLADTINRSNVGASQRMRNEMMRVGAQTPDSFAMQNQPQIQQAQQPSEFLGAGRRELPAGSDPSLVTALGGQRSNVGGQEFYYSPYDISKASWGLQDTDDLDLGGGKYSIMQNGQNLGTGYKSLQDSIKELLRPTSKQKWIPDSTPYSPGGYDAKFDVTNQATPVPEGYRVNGTGDGLERMLSGYTLNGQDFYNDLDSANQAVPGLASRLYTGNTLKDWETLGQILNSGSVSGDYTTPHSMGGNKVADPISGLNTLFGSKPIIYDGKLLGYNQAAETNPLIDEWNQQSQWSSGGGFFTRPKQYAQWDVGAAALGRDFQNPAWWNQNTQHNSDGSYFITPDKAEQSPGWLNSDYFARDAGFTESGGGFGIGQFTGNLMKHVDPLSWAAHGGDSWFKNVDKNGLYATVFDRLDPWLDDLDPGHETGQNALTDLMGNDTQKETFKQIAPAFVNYFVPFGGLINAADSANQGNWNGAIASLVGQAISSYAPTATSAAPVETAVDGASGAAANSMGSAGASTGIYGTGSSLGSVAADRAVQSLVNNTVTGSIANGGNLGQALQSAAFSTASGAAGDWLSKALTPEYGQIAGKALGGAASGGLNSLFSGNSPIKGSLFGAMSGGLHGFLNSTAAGTNTLDRPTDEKNRQAALAATKLAKIVAASRKK